MEMARKEEIENVICIEEADSKLTKCAELLANNDKNEMKEDNKSALNFIGHSFCSAQLPKLADAVKYGVGDVLDSTHIPTEMLSENFVREKLKTFGCRYFPSKEFFRSKNNIRMVCIYDSK